MAFNLWVDFDDEYPDEVPIPDLTDAERDALLQELWGDVEERPADFDDELDISDDEYIDDYV